MQESADNEKERKRNQKHRKLKSISIACHGNLCQPDADQTVFHYLLILVLSFREGELKEEEVAKPPGSMETADLNRAARRLKQRPTKNLFLLHPPRCADFALLNAPADGLPICR